MKFSLGNLHFANRITALYFFRFQPYKEKERERQSERDKQREAERRRNFMGNAIYEDI